ncbi:competence protein ComEA [Oceanisphaera litoralis]|uniref:ComEA family DNA-binding protein n=1 Tax=Oceanisphaera litoralis TaxID=225144 RepID=UPI00195B1CB7|nr:helix-hairpin-helix domain-containing protein [Oceanisphaera litoralis]MBM7454805.1 competence protein ComEA [Oceanisphaera litoralis]
MNKALLSTLLAALLTVAAPSMANKAATAQNAVVTSIDINNATQDQLAMLTGIGPAKAAAIVEYREANGPFNKVDDLANVSGIGPATIEKNRHLLSN